MLIGRSVLGEAAKNFVVALTAATAIAFFMLSITFLKRTPGVGMSFLLEVFPLFFPLALQFTVPMAVLTATVVTFGRMSGDRELTALAASGLPLWTVARPVLAGGAVLALVALILLDVVSPFASQQLRSAKRDIFQQLQTSFRSGLRDLDFGRGHLSFGSYKDGRFKDICIEVREKNGEPKLLRAQTGNLSLTKDGRILLSLHNAEATFPYDTRRTLRVSLGEYAQEFSINELTDDPAGSRKRTGLRDWELSYVAQREVTPGPYSRINATGAREELARRTALAASAFIFVLVGIPIGVLTGRGGKAAAFLTGVAPVLLLYFPLVLAGSNLARTGAAPAFPALWSGNFVLGVLGWFLLKRVASR